MRRSLPLTLPLLLLLGCGASETTEPTTTDEQSDVTRSAGDEQSGAASAGDADELPPAPTVAGQEARQLVEQGAVLLDVTPPARAEETFIEGRTLIPLPDLRDRLGELPRDRTIVVYCFQGLGSPRAGAILQAEGFDVRVMGAHTNWPDGGGDGGAGVGA